MNDFFQASQVDLVIYGMGLRGNSTLINIYLDTINECLLVQHRRISETKRREIRPLLFPEINTSSERNSSQSCSA